MKSLILLIFSSFCALTWAQIVELDSMGNLQKHLSKNTLIVFDLDNTVMHPSQDLGSDEWFFHRMNSYLNSGMSRDVAFEKLYGEYFLAQALTEAELVERVTAPLILDLQQKGYAVMALTTRSLNLLYPTNRQLQSLSVDFSKSAPVIKDCYFSNSLPVLYRNGILFTNGTDKGDSFNRFCELSGYAPTAVVFINDKASDLLQVEKGCEKKSIPFLGLRYGFLDERVKNYTDRLANVQQEQLKGILSNEEAQKLLK